LNWFTDYFKYIEEKAGEIPAFIVSIQQNIEKEPKPFP
jgi:hypothetical protein